MSPRIGWLVDKFGPRPVIAAFEVLHFEYRQIRPCLCPIGFCRRGAT